jgi:TRAP-type mannitol/chloroaromatic compound transport system permease small subunit
MIREQLRERWLLIPLRQFADMVDEMNERIGRALAWLALFMVLLQFAIVVMRYVFGLGSVVAQEAMVYMHATLFLAGASYALLHDGHVRCDIVYGDTSPRTHALIDLGGVVLFLLPMCIVIFWVSWPYVTNAWAVLEGSPEGGLGIPAIFLLKSVILVFAVLLGLQAISMAIHAGLRLTGLEGLSDLEGFTDGLDDEGPAS